MLAPWERYRRECEEASLRERRYDPSRHRYRDTDEGGCLDCGRPRSEHTYAAEDRAYVSPPCPNCGGREPHSCVDA